MFVGYCLHLQGLMIEGFNSMFVFGRAMLLGLFMVLVLGLKARVKNLIWLWVRGWVLEAPSTL